MGDVGKIEVETKDYVNFHLSKIIKHEKFDKTFFYDIALLKLIKPIVVSI